MQQLRLLTRGSALAIAQSRWVAARLQAIHPGLEVDLRIVTTRGDRITHVPLAQVGGKGLFVKEIEDALLNEEGDLAVHSLKDMPSQLPPGLILAAVPEREDPRDALVLPIADCGLRIADWGAQAADDRSPTSTRHSSVPNPQSAAPLHERQRVIRNPQSDAGLPVKEGGRVGSSSLRRRAQLRAWRPDVRVESVRGNVDTRLRKLDEGSYDAIILAAAGLRRLGLASRISLPLPVERFVPAVGQGALAIEARESDARTCELLAALEHPPTRLCVTAERAFLARMEGDCSVPLGALATCEGDRLSVVGMLADAEGLEVIRRTTLGPISQAAELGAGLAADILGAGGTALRTA